MLIDDERRNAEQYKDQVSGTDPQGTYSATLLTGLLFWSYFRAGPTKKELLG